MNMFPEKIYNQGYRKLQLNPVTLKLMSEIRKKWIRRLHSIPPAFKYLSQYSIIDNSQH